MKLKDTRENYQYFSSKTSEIIRYLGLAGIGLIWLFKIDVSGKQTIPPELIKPTCLIVLSLALDLLHYITGTIIWGSYSRHKEKLGTKEEDEFLAPRRINWPAITFFWSKIIAMIVAYYFLLRFFTNKVF